MDNNTPKEEVKSIHMPINKLSYSGLTQLLRNPLIFKLKQILGVYDSKMGVSAMIGRSGHEALKFYYGGNKDLPVPADIIERREEAIKVGMDYLNTVDDGWIKYGKTGSRESMLQDYHKTMRLYFEYEPTYRNITCCEERLEAEIKNHDGQVFPLPAVGVPDLINEYEEGKYEIVDAKFTKSFTNYTNDDGEPYEDYVKIIQAKFLDYLVKATKDIQATRVVFREIKRSINKDGSPQIRDYVIPLDHEPYDIIFTNLYADVVKFVSNPNSIYLPNLSDPFDGEQAGLLYAQGLLNADMSDIEVMHKVKDVALVSRKFVSSRLDKIENQYLAPEEKIKLRMAEFGIPIEPVETKVGASVTQYRFKVSAGISMNRFKKHKDDIARAIEAKTDIRILAPIPGTSLIGIEVPTADRKIIHLEKKHLTPKTLMLPIGVDIHGEVVRIALNEMPHLLIAGSTGSGKSILLHTIITALKKQMTPSQMEMVLIDPKRVELVAFKNIPHLKGKKIIYEYTGATKALATLVEEMERRYEVLEKQAVRDIGEYHKKISGGMPYIVVVIDEFADLMMQSKQTEKQKKGKGALKKIANKKFVEEFAKQEAKRGRQVNLEELDTTEDLAVDEMIIRLAQMARAVGIHMIIATQRPSVDVITGLIKANFPTRIALTTASHVDSEVIIGESGAEKLTGKGDMLLMHPGASGKQRLQGFLIK